jgi:nucleotide-binding universal stress UspA family protein
MTATYETIVVGYEDSDQAKDALALGRQIADATGAQLVLSHVFVFHPMMRSGIDSIELDEERELDTRTAAVASGIGATSWNVDSTSVARGLHELADQAGADLVIVGSSRHGKAGQTLLGNVAVALMHGSPCAVAVAPSGYRDRAAEPVSAILVGYDGSPESTLALESAYDLARAHDARVQLVTVANPPPIVVGKSGGASGGWHALKEELEHEARARLDAARSSAPEDVTVEATLVTGEPVAALADEAKAPGSILVLGSRAYGPVRRVLLGSISRALADSAPAPLIVYPRGVHAEPRTSPRAAAGKQLRGGIET